MMKFRTARAEREPFFASLYFSLLAGNFGEKFARDCPPPASLCVALGRSSAFPADNAAICRPGQRAVNANHRLRS